MLRRIANVLLGASLTVTALGAQSPAAPALPNTPAGTVVKAWYDARRERRHAADSRFLPPVPTGAHRPEHRAVPQRFGRLRRQRWRRKHQLHGIRVSAVMRL